MSTYDDLAARIPIQQIAAQLGEDPAEVERAVHTVLPGLLGGLQANAADPAAAASLATAVGHHATNFPASGAFDLGQIDAGDGAKIAQHVFGSNTDQVINQLGVVGGGSNSGLIAKLMPLLAPIVLAYLGKQMGQSAGSGGGAGGGAGGGVLGSILGSILGGAASGMGGGSSSSNIDLGSILGGLGGLLGGGTR